MYFLKLLPVILKIYKQFYATHISFNLVLVLIYTKMTLTRFADVFTQNKFTNLMAIGPSKKSEISTSKLE